MKNLISWAAFCAVLCLVSVQVSDFLESNNLIGPIVGGVVVFGFAYRFLNSNPGGNKRQKTRSTGYRRKPRTKTRSNVVPPTTRPRKDPPVGHYRPNGSYIPEQYRQSPNK